MSALVALQKKKARQQDKDLQRLCDLFSGQLIECSFGAEKERLDLATFYRKLSTLCIKDQDDFIVEL